MDSSHWEQYSAPDAELQAILAHMPAIPSFADYGTATQLRESLLKQFGQLIEAGILVPVDWSGYEKFEVQIPTRDGDSLRAVVYKAAGKELGPLLVYYHGGGWTFGMPEAGESYFEALVKELGVTVVSVGYRLAPEHVFPTAAHDAVDALKWCAENADVVGADAMKGFIVAGSSAGGSLAAASAHQAIDDNTEPKLTGVVLLSPNLCHHDAVPEEWKKHYRSFEEHKNAPILDRRGIDFLFDQYKAHPKAPLASPLLWHTHAGQPPTYLQVTGLDPLRDEALIYEHILKEAAAPVKVDIFAGIPHGGPDFFPMHSCARKAVLDLKKGVEWILNYERCKA